VTPFSAPLPEALAGERLDRVVAMLCDLPRSVAAELVDAREVRVDGEVQTRRSRRVAVGEVISLDVPEPPPDATVDADASVQFEVAHEDEHLLVVDKPPGLVVHPGSGNATGTLVHGLLARYPEIATVGDELRPGIVHRLDRDTSGLLIVARTDEAFDALSAAMRSRRITRRYHTLVWGHLDEPRGMVDAPIARSPREPTRMAVVVGGR
jgi:23S rRNA pseudouridine1911/1915/1917 synthase